LFILQLLAKLRQLTLTSHNKSQLKQHEPSLPNALAKQQHKGRQGKKQPAAVSTKQKPAGKATSKWQSQGLSGKRKPSKQQKQNNKRTRMPAKFRGMMWACWPLQQSLRRR